MVEATARQGWSAFAGLAVLVGAAGTLGAWVGVKLNQSPAWFGKWMIRFFGVVAAVGLLTIAVLVATGGVDFKTK